MDGLRDGLLIDFDYAIHDRSDRDAADLERTVSPGFVKLTIVELT